jgi:hypothetical protein
VLDLSSWLVDAARIRVTGRITNSPSAHASAATITNEPLLETTDRFKASSLFGP